MSDSLRAPLTSRTVHLCVDMQRLFSAEGPWPTPWMERVLPTVERIARYIPERTLFSRFITPHTPDEMPGVWGEYYVRWRTATRSELDPRLLELMPALDALAPPARVFDKMVYSAFASATLRQELAKREVDTLVITGSETDVCVLATVMGAVDRGYRVVLVSDGVCSSSDRGHDALLSLFRQRYSLQIEVAEAETILSAWPK